MRTATRRQKGATNTLRKASLKGGKIPPTARKQKDPLIGIAVVLLESSKKSGKFPCFPFDHGFILARVWYFSRNRFRIDFQLKLPGQETTQNSLKEIVGTKSFSGIPIAAYKFRIALSAKSLMKEDICFRFRKNQRGPEVRFDVFHMRKQNTLRISDPGGFEGKLCQDIDVEINVRV